jgi:hypothetical protein
LADAITTKKIILQDTQEKTDAAIALY